MQKSRTIFIGDIHGCYKEFKLLIKKLDIKEFDKVFLVGDIINKGPYSYKVLNFVYKNRKLYKCVLGNNEVNFLNFLKGNFNKNHKHFKKLKNKIEKHKKYKLIKYLEELPLYIEEKEYIVLHGGLIPNKKIEDHSIDEITRLREYNGKLWYKYYNGNKKIIYGHNALDGLQIREKTIGIDSGCVYGKSLTAYILETGEIYSQNALDIYLNVFKKENFILEKLKKIFK
ncbi:metallophosphoesterase [Candidatus Gracilibacteria bacterium]|nr:metallophosphoesterase [Candidatus Gracilibacteria bacterium]